MLVAIWILGIPVIGFLCMIAYRIMSKRNMYDIDNDESPIIPFLVTGSLIWPLAIPVALSILALVKFIIWMWKTSEKVCSFDVKKTIKKALED